MAASTQPPLPMNSSRDPFGFEPPTPGPKPGYSPRPITIIAQPGQEVRIVAADGTGVTAGDFPDASRSSPLGSTDASRSSPSGSTDASRSSPSGSTDASRSSPSGSPDSRWQNVAGAASDPFGFGAGNPKAGYNPRPITVVAQPGQEVRIVVPDGSGAVYADYADASRSSPLGSTDASRSSPSGGH